MYFSYPTLIPVIKTYYRLTMMITYEEHSLLPNPYSESSFKEKVSKYAVFININNEYLTGDSLEELNGYGTMKPRTLISTILGGTPARAKALPISNPHDFRQVSAIIDVDIVPETCRRVRLLKHGSDKPLGFYIRDGSSVKVTQNGQLYHTWLSTVIPIICVLCLNRLRENTRSFYLSTRSGGSSGIHRSASCKRWSARSERNRSGRENIRSSESHSHLTVKCQLSIIYSFFRWRIWWSQTVRIWS